MTWDTLATGDGSTTLVHPVHGEAFHSRAGAWQEARERYALACGLPVAAYPVPGPGDIIGTNECGIHGGKDRIGALDEDLGSAISRALKANSEAAATEAAHYSWDRCTGLFFQGLSREAA